MSTNLQYQDGTGISTVITGGTLATGNRVAQPFDNTVNLDLYGDAFLTLHYDTSAPTAGTAIAELYLLPGNTVVTPSYPQGGDGSVGTNVDPQKVLLVGVFETRSPSTSVDEILAVVGIPLSPRLQRFVLKNISGQTFHTGFTLTLKPYKLQSV